MELSSDQIIQYMQNILSKNGTDNVEITESKSLREINFRSLDFAELCLIVEEDMDKELNFDAGQLRKIENVGDVCNFLESAVK